ncbi:MAG: methyltransferase domain-containing protein, partial [Muribaculaceae bacterium]|nr:methyltransferase domain-containing protein [Muribaculaceae bacterium]
EELKMMGELQATTPSEIWSKCYISEKDAIIPPSNQRNAWTGFRITELEGEPHCPDFRSIIDNDIIDKQLIGRRFSENTTGYNIEASTQRHIAENLYQMLVRHTELSAKKILEIGIGTGFLTSLYCQSPISSESAAVDLADRDTIRNVLTEADINYNGTIVTDDAERYVERCGDAEVDILVSSSTIQWFCNIKRFLSNVARILKRDGIAAISTFQQGTYSEIKEITGRTLNYPTLSELIEMLPDNLKAIETMNEEHIVRFNNGRSLLNHIKTTGVNSIGSPMNYADTRQMLRRLDSNPQLTYRPVYLILKKI